MNFFTNRIVNPAGDGPSFEDWLVDYLAKNADDQIGQEKVASEKAAPGIGMDAGNEPRGQMRGQVINTEGEEAMTNDPEMPKEQGGNARPDTGGTTDQKKHEQADKGASSAERQDNIVEATCGKEMGESDDAGKVTEEHTEAGPGDDQNPDPKVLINNDPCYQKGESTDPAKAKGKSKKQPDDPVVKAQSRQFKKIASMNRNEKLALFATLSANKTNPITYVEAMTNLKFANMTDDEKTWFKDFWKVLYPPEYVEEMVADR